MRKKPFLLLFALFLFMACTQDDESVYSCDETMNNWVKQNMFQIRLMTRSDWKLLEDSKKIPAYRAFSTKQKIDFWHQKFEEVKNLKWTSDELKHIKSAENFLNNHLDFFENRKLTDNQSDELDMFFYSWLQQGMKDFGWSQSVGLAIVASGEVITDTKGGIILKTPSPGNNEEEIPNCQCHAGNSFTVCGQYSSCEDVECLSGYDGCGWLLFQECNGRCVD